VQVLDVRKGETCLPQEDRLTQEDWLVLRKSAEILKPIYEHTMRFQSRAKQGHHGAIWGVLPSMELILQHLEGLKERYPVSNVREAPPPQQVVADGLLVDHDEPSSPTPPHAEWSVAQNTRRLAQRRPVGYVPLPVVSNLR
jgi:hypothetical protein